MVNDLKRGFLAPFLSVLRDKYSLSHPSVIFFQKALA